MCFSDLPRRGASRPRSTASGRSSPSSRSSRCPRGIARAWSLSWAVRSVRSLLSIAAYASATVIGRGMLPESRPVPQAPAAVFIWRIRNAPRFRTGGLGYAIYASYLISLVALVVIAVHARGSELALRATLRPNRRDDRVRCLVFHLFPRAFAPQQPDTHRSSVRGHGGALDHGRAATMARRPTIRIRAGCRHRRSGGLPALVPVGMQWPNLAWESR